MALIREEKEIIINHFKQHDTDTGSPEVQVAILTTDVKILTDHLRNHRHDFHSRQGLFKKIARRKKLLEYLKRKSASRYAALIKELGIRK